MTLMHSQLGIVPSAAIMLKSLTTTHADGKFTAAMNVEEKLFTFHVQDYYWRQENVEHFVFIGKMYSIYHDKLNAFSYCSFKNTYLDNRSITFLSPCSRKAKTCIQDLTVEVVCIIFSKPAVQIMSVHTLCIQRM